MAKATKAAREKAFELSVNLDDVEGTGSGGQITVGDVNSYDANRPKQESDEEGHFFRDAVSGATPGSEKNEPGSEAEKDAAFLAEQTRRGGELRGNLTTVTKDVQDVYEMELAARERGDRGMDATFEESPHGLQPSAEEDEKEEIVSKQVRIHFNPNAGTNRVIVDGEAYVDGDIMESDVYEGVRDMQSSGHNVFADVEQIDDEDAPQEPAPREESSESAPVEQHEKESGKDAVEDSSSEQQAVREGGE